jgi:hypothetical protein
MKSLCLFVLPVLLLAQEQTPRSTERSRAGTGVQDPVVDFHDSLADYFRLSSRAISAIAEKGIPDQEIPVVLMIARRSGSSPNEIIDARKSGKQWADIAKSHNVTFPGGDIVKEANVAFLSAYHVQPEPEIRAMLAKGATYVAVNQQLRRVGMRKKTEAPSR